MKNSTFLVFLLLGAVILLISKCNNVTQQNEQLSSSEIDSNYLKLGLKYATSAKKVLGKNLLGAIYSRGTENALEFCSEKAYPLTDSVAIALNVNIKRVSDKPRNPKNAANESELEYISLVKKKTENIEMAQPKLQEIGDKIIGYYPIITNEMCLLCHGKPNTNIQPKVLDKINQLYAQDKAIGYDKDQLRGIWVIEMDKNINIEKGIDTDQD